MRRVRKGAALVSVVFLLLLMPEARVEAETIRAGDVLRITFDLPPGYSDLFGNLDFFEFDIFLRQAEPIGSFTTRLFDGPELLGTYSSPLGTDPIPLAPSRFISPTSIYTGPAAVVDFTAFNNGTIDGRLEFTISSGSGTLMRTSDELSVGHAISPEIGTTGGVSTGSFAVIPGDAPSPVPEPATRLLAAAGLAAIVVKRSQRRGE